MKKGGHRNEIFRCPPFGALEYLKSKTQRVMATGVFTNVNDLARNPIATQQAGHYNTPSSFVPERSISSYNRQSHTDFPSAAKCG